MAPKIESDHIQDDDGALPSGGNGSPPTKKRRQLDVGESPKKRCRRKREELCQLNLDVLFLIAKYVHPMDLLNLARTCKSLRGLLMDKCSTFVWKTARCQVIGLPDCPADLTEPEYANLVFCARCHNCGKPARTVLWKIRRRYCANCKPERVYELSSCSELIRENDVLPCEILSIDDEMSKWVDKGQMELFLHEYSQSTDRVQFLKERQNQNCAIFWHARDCERWQKTKAAEHRYDLAARREKREKSIFERLEQHGYGQEIAYFGHSTVRLSHKAVFKASKALADKEWDRMWPEWHKIMDDYRLTRIYKTVYQPRLTLLANEYDAYVMHPTPDGPTFDLLPHVLDLACFAPFQAILGASEGAPVDDKTFVPAFAQLPDLVDEWKKKLDVELAELIKIPPHLSLESASSGQNTKHREVSQTNLDKLQLACAVFGVGLAGPFNHLEVFSASMRDYDFERDSDRTGSMRDRFRIEFSKKAPYIVRACGLDPNTATVDDMNRRNARLMCLSCKYKENSIMNWRVAMWHASGALHSKVAVAPPFEIPRWQLVNDEHIDAIQAVEQSAKKELSGLARCLLCRSRVGDASYDDGTVVCHLIHCHNIEEDKIKLGVHYRHVGVVDLFPKVVMVQGKGKTTFKIIRKACI